MKYLTRSFHKAFGFLAVAFGTLLLPSCAEEFLSDDQVDDGIEMVLNVGTDTRTINEGDHTLWADDDVLTVIHAPEDGNEFWASPFNKSGDNAFTGKVKRLSSSNDWYVVYPYKEENLAADQISLSFPASQIQTGNENMLHIAGEQFPLWGKVKGLPRGQTLNVQMQNLLAVAGFKVKNTTDGPITVTQVQFTAPTSVSGTFTVDLTGDAPVLTAGTGATKVVTLNVESGEELAADATSWFYMAVTPFEAPAGSKLKIKVIATDSKGKDVVFYQIKTLDEATSFNSGSIKTVNIAYDTAHTTDPDAGSAGEVPLEPGDQPADGEYLLVYEDGENSYAFAAFADKEADNYAIPVTVVDGVVLPSETEDLSRYAMTIENAGIEHPNDAGHYAYNVKNSEGKFIFYASGGGDTKILRIQDTNELYNTSSQETVAYYHTFIQEEDGIQILSSGGVSGYNKYLLTYSDAKGFHYSNDTADQGKKLHLYLVGGSVKEKQTLTFTPDNVSYDFDAGGDFPEPMLNGAHTSLRWSSNNEAVATVNENGNVTIHAAGNATITVRADADDTYYAATASYTITATTTNTQTWYKADEIVDGETYLIISHEYALQNNGSNVANAVKVVFSGDVILYNAPSDVLWKASASSGYFTFQNNGQYLQRGSSGSSFNSSYFPIASTSTSNYYQWSYNSGAERIFTKGSYSTYYVYYSTSSNKWAISTNESDHPAALYTTTKPLTPQTISFNKSNIRWIVGEGYEIDRSYDFPQIVNDAHTQVTYSSSKESVATINGTQITIKGLGSTTITATAAEENGYKSAVATYTLRIAEPITGDWVDLNLKYNNGEPFNLENDAVREYLDAAATEYSESNITSKSILKTYYNKYSSNRLDIPKPVTIRWDEQSSGTATVTIFADQGMEEVVWTQTASSGSTSSDVYNLIPGKTYYCTVEDADSQILLQGEFETTGRRRMMKVSDKTNSNSFAGNCRDLGGLKTTNGKRIKYGYIYRGTNLDGLDEEEMAYMLGYMNIGLDNELREGTRENRLGVRFVNPGYSGTNDLQDETKFKRTMQAFIDVAIIDHKASYFHCAIGADRTGYTGFMIEALLGVSANDCSIDYEMTSFANPIIGGDRLRNGGGMLYYFGEARDYINRLNYSSALSLQGKVIKYVNEELEISMDDINAFLEEVLEDDPDL